MPKLGFIAEQKANLTVFFHLEVQSLICKSQQHYNHGTNYNGWSGHAPRKAQHTSTQTWNAGCQNVTSRNRLWPCNGPPTTRFKSIWGAFTFTDQWCILNINKCKTFQIWNSLMLQSSQLTKENKGTPKECQEFCFICFCFFNAVSTWL